MFLKASIIIPAHNEAGYIGACLSALLGSLVDAASVAVDIVVVANACTDQTAEIARGYQHVAHARGWNLSVQESEVPGKLNALNLGDAATVGSIRVYLDADVIISPDLVGELISALDRRAPAYASGQPEIPPARSWISRTYARFWATLPFFSEDVPGFGVYAVNTAGRSRWGAFPDIISDDTFVRLQFAPAERFSVPATFLWPMVEGFANLVRVRRRQDAGVVEVAQKHPQLTTNAVETKPATLGLFRRLLADPVGFSVYALVSVAVRLPIVRSPQRWARGR